MRTPWQSFRLDLERAPVRLWSALGRLEAFGETLAALPVAPAMAAALAETWRGKATAGAFAAEAETNGAAAVDPEVAAVISTLYEQIDRDIEREGDDRPALSPQTLCADNAALTEIAGAAGLLGAGGGDASLADQFAEVILAPAFSAGAREVRLIMAHTTRDGEPRLVEQCSYPLTARARVGRVYTDLAVVDVTPSGFVVREIVDGVSAEELAQKSGAPLEIASDCKSLTAPDL